MDLFKENIRIQDLSRADLNYGYTASHFNEMAAYAHVSLDADREIWYEVAQEAEEQQRPLIVVGNLTNTYLTHNAFSESATVSNNDPFDDARNDIGKYVRIKGGIAECSGAMALSTAIEYLCYEGWPFHPLAGFPGTVAGGAIGNSGNSVAETGIGDFTEYVKVFDVQRGRFETLDVADWSRKYGQDFFDPRHSWLADQNSQFTRYVVTDVGLRLDGKLDENVSQKQYDAFMQIRQQKNSIGLHTIGSNFVNSAVPHHAAEIYRQLPGTTKKTPLFRDLIDVALPDEASRHFGRVWFTKIMAFMKINGPNDVALDQAASRGYSTTQDRVGGLFDFTPRLEVNIAGARGMVTLDEFKTTSQESTDNPTPTIEHNLNHTLVKR